jgi:hypothetical protein
MGIPYWICFDASAALSANKSQRDIFPVKLLNILAQDFSSTKVDAAVALEAIGEGGSHPHELPK